MTAIARHAPATPVGDDAPGRPVVWRTWVVAADADGRPILTGIFGYPWPAPVLDARCLHTEESSPIPFSTCVAGRYHRVVPDVRCSCGVYAMRRPLGPAPRYGVVRSRPTAAGFIELSGRVIAEPDRYRAQRATIVGPLSVALPAVPRLLRPVLPSAARPKRVVEEPGRYRFAWIIPGPGEPPAEWLRRVGAGLSDRYGVPVLSVPG